MPWSPSNPPVRGGSYTRFLTKRKTVLPSGAGEVVALPITHDWGPFQEMVGCDDLPEFIGVYGEGGDPSNDVFTPGFIAAHNAFKGENANAPGAGRVIFYRTGAVSANEASKVFQNTTPANAITVEAIYKGTRGNKLRITIEANDDDPTTHHDFVVLEGGVVYERFKYVKTDLASLRAKVNNVKTGSGWVTIPAAPAVDGVALGLVANVALEGGNDGATLTSTEWSDIQSAYEAEGFGVFAPYDLTDGSLKASLATWAIGRNSPVNKETRSQRFQLVLGGVGDEDASDAIDEAADFNNENVCRVGVGTFRDTTLGITLSTSQLAPRIAGVLARRGVRASIFAAVLEDLEIITAPTDAEIVACIGGGVINLTQGTGGVRIEAQVTTYTDDTDDKPLDPWGKIRPVVTMQRYERRLRETQERLMSQGLTVNKDSRETFVGEAQALLNEEFIREGAVQPGAQAVLTMDPPPSDDDVFIGIDTIAKWGRSVEQVRNSVYLS